VKLKRLLLAAALIVGAAPTLAAADDFIPQVSLEAAAIGVIGSLPGAENNVPYDNKPELPGKEEGNDIYLFASSPESKAISDVMSWR
jgi:hypothetical protein